MGCSDPHHCSLGAAPCHLLFMLTRAILVASLFHRPKCYRRSLRTAIMPVRMAVPISILNAAACDGADALSSHARLHHQHQQLHPTLAAAHSKAQKYTRVRFAESRPTHWWCALHCTTVSLAKHLARARAEYESARRIRRPLDQASAR